MIPSSVNATHSPIGRWGSLHQLIGLAFVCLAFAAPALAQTTPPTTQVTTVTVGPNVNMSGGPAWYDPARNPILMGDPFLQRENEPSKARSSRNECHRLAGANYYGLVDLEEALDLETADAWLGVYKTDNCGVTYSLTPFPGHPLDTSPEGMASPCKGFSAAADPTVVAGPSGMFHYGGICFDRATNKGLVVQALFNDTNNTDGTDSIKYIKTVEIDRGAAGQFLDKEWLAVDRPRNPLRTCSILGQTIPAYNVYYGYASFLGSGNNQHTSIWVARSIDCGLTFATTKVSESSARNQGLTMAVDDATGALYVAWREFAVDATTQDSIMFVKSTDGGKQWTRVARIEPPHPVTGEPYRLRPFDQIATPTTFRTLMFPTMTCVPSEDDGRPAGQESRCYIAFAARGFAAPRGGDGTSTAGGDARIVYTSSVGGTNWTFPTPADAYPGAGNQLQPALTYSGGKLVLAYYDLRNDWASPLGLEDFVVEYGQQYWGNFVSGVFQKAACLNVTGTATTSWLFEYMSCMLSHNYLLSRHTIDVRAAMVDSSCLQSGACRFSSYSALPEDSVPAARVSKYLMTGPSTSRQQIQYNRPNLPLFRKGTYPFIGDYIALACPVFTTDGNGNFVLVKGSTPNRPAIACDVAWTDNRDVIKPRFSSNPDWTNFTSGVKGPNAVVCQEGQTGIRNQNIYTAQIRPGLVVTVPVNTKKIAALQRSFVVVARNTTNEAGSYTLRVRPPAGIIASFDQFSGFGDGTPPTPPLLEISAVIPPRSSISRTVFLGLADPNVPVVASVPVDVVEGSDWSCTTCERDTAYVNPDFDSPDFDSPDFDSKEFHTPDFDSGDPSAPDFDSPDFDSYTLTSAGVQTPDFDSPDFDSPDFDSPDFDSPDFDSPDFDSKDMLNPDFDSPDFDSPDFDSATVYDTTWPMHNLGNTTSAYKINLQAPPPVCVLKPDGTKKCVKYQLVVRRLNPVPVAACSTGPSPNYSAQNEVLVNIVDPDTNATSLRDREYNAPDRTNATFHLSPTEDARVTLRAYCPAGVFCPPADPSKPWVKQVSLGVVAEAADCTKCGGPGEPTCTGSDRVHGGSECPEEPPKDIYDPIPPVISFVTQDPASDVDDNGSEPVSFIVKATDNLGIRATEGVICTGGLGPITSTGIAGDQYSFSGSFAVGTTTVDCTAYDQRTLNLVPAPNEASVSFVVTVNDVTAPVFDERPNPGSPFTPSNPAEATGPSGAQVFYTNPTATDSNGGSVTVTCQSDGGLVSGNTFPIGTTDINCVATDQSGVSTPPTNLFDITVADTTPPVVTVSGAPTAAVEGNTLGGANVTFSASASDTVAGALPATCAPASGSTFPIGTTTVTCSATDRAVPGNTGSSSFAVTVVDTTPPTVTLNGNASITLEAGSSFVDPGATAGDVVSGPLGVITSGSVNTLVPGTYVLTYTATDGSGNVGSKTRTVIVKDTIAPVIAPSSNVIAEATSAGGALVTYTSPTWTDTVSGSGTASCTPTSGSVFPLGTTTVTCTASDVAGNAATPTTFTVMIRDTIAPAVTCPAPTSAVADASGNLTIPNVLAGVVATDAVTPSGSLVKTQSPAAGTIVPAGTYTITVTVKDAAGNTSTCTTTFSAIFYGFTGFLTPLKPAGTDTSPSNSGASTLGKALPLKWKLTLNGAVVSSLSSLKSIQARFNTDCAGLPEGPLEYTLYSPVTGATGNSTFRWDATNSQFIFNWDTTQVGTNKGCYSVRLQLSDGSPLKVTLVTLK